MKNPAVILLILYAIMMLSYGSLEMTHDLLHYLAAHHHSHLHDHKHGHHHHVNDHQHAFEVHSGDAASNQTDLPSLIHFFLYAQSKPDFRFTSELTEKVCSHSYLFFQPVEKHPLTPPPEKA